jgi:S-adenosylmethionine:tRNA ribosyltransferase-isomerase
MKPVHLHDYTYELPDHRIARYPLPQRDQSKLLVYRQGKIEHAIFSRLDEYLPHNSRLFFNDTKVIPARLFFAKPTGAVIEVLLLNPVSPSPSIAHVMDTRQSCIWQCTIGNLKRWSEGASLKLDAGGHTLEAHLSDREKGLVEFRWTDDVTFAAILDLAGVMPLPPYLRRDAEQADRERYQTVYSRIEGAVAAPTAGLHFTDRVLDKLRTGGFTTDFLTLHVSAGTFLPVKHADATQHVMHAEHITVTRSNILNLLDEEKPVVAVGTTSMRTLESLYWYGTKLLEKGPVPFIIDQNIDTHLQRGGPSARDAFARILQHMDEQNVDTLHGQTSIYILPGYTFRVCRGLITNFHRIYLAVADRSLHWR